MSEQKPQSLQDIIRQRRQSKFVGRSEQLDAFRANLGRAWDDPQRRFIFNIFGQGGVGKTTLLQEFQQMARQHGAAVALTDEDESSVPAALARLANQLEEQGHDFDEFLKRYRVYRRKREELESDPEAPRGLAAFIGRTATHVTLHALKQAPGVGGAVEMVEADAAAEQVGQWTEFVHRRLTNKDERKLVLEPEQTLTPLFIEALAEVTAKNTAVLMFDTFEQTGAFLDNWLRRLLDGDYGNLPAELMFVIAGRHELNRDHWLPYEQVLVRIELNPFTEREVRDYLAGQEIKDEKIVSVILELSGRLPLLVAMLAAQRPSDPGEVGTAVGTAIERFLKWVDDAQRRQLAMDAALPRVLNRDVAELLLPEEADAAALFEWLKGMPFTREREYGWVYHEVVREQMLRHKMRESVDSWAALHQRLADYYEERRTSLELGWEQGVRDEMWQGYRLAALYHQLCAQPHTALAPALTGFLKAIVEPSPVAEKWAAALHQAGVDCDNDRVKRWGKNLLRGIQAHQDADYPTAREMITGLLEWTDIPAHQQAVALLWRGQIGLLMKDYEQAVADFDRVIDLNPELHIAFVFRGGIYGLMNKYRLALADLDRAIDLNPEFSWIFGVRGETYLKMGEHEQALADFNQAIDLDPDFDSAFASRGTIYLILGKSKRALADFDKAIELGRDDSRTFALRGLASLKMGDHEGSLTDFDRAIELNPELNMAFVGRGMSYQYLGRHEQALADFEELIELDPKHSQAFALRGQSYLLMGEHERALANFNRAIELNPELKVAIAGRGKSSLRMGKPERALADFEKLIELDPEDRDAIALRDEAYRLMDEEE